MSRIELDYAAPCVGCTETMESLAQPRSRGRSEPAPCDGACGAQARVTGHPAEPAVDDSVVVDPFDRTAVECDQTEKINVSTTRETPIPQLDHRLRGSRDAPQGWRSPDRGGSQRWMFDGTHTTVHSRRRRGKTGTALGRSRLDEQDRRPHRYAIVARTGRGAGR